MKKKLNRSDDNSLLHALRHPLRRQLLRRMIGEKPISPRELATEMDEPLSNVSYHMKVLADCGALTLVRTKPVRGSMKHFYRARVKAPWAFEMLGLNPNGDNGKGESSAAPDT